MSAKKSNTPVYLALALLLLGGVGFLVFTGLSEDSSYFLNVSEALAMEPTKLDQARLFGTVHARDIRMSQDAPGVAFILEDKDDTAKTIHVTYHGAVPDTFKAGAEVIVEGGLDPSSHVFGATTLMTKCPSKYQKQNRDT
ncbi:cytochrome c maturation protein CcmE [Oceanidesulfovibrio marinus]|uniref:Cytochrome c maturation protein CcmE n=1 Tax=Oceanidesulfovibrio marinus TaxID=370038 RepID=A0A6P1ZJ47_9BACT|nr:cytochrome c maturation protein CcmE [Oceanidesulfovibrio marinus]QJT08449.1 cytochrome c maturation protein CcmE [Oceanidesulfovibrio marinus]TVM33170.1 cytochrome c maturation protein CcmE [Oceanidesulfovibrio marinus]